MTDMEEFDVPMDVPTDKLEILNNHLSEAIALERMIATWDEDLKTARAALHKARTGTIPDLMAELQMDEVTFKGWKVTVSDFVSGSMPKEATKLAAAIKWLEDHEAGGLIKTAIAVSFGREQNEEAKATYEGLVSEGLAATMGSTVHAQTLQSFARQRIKDGDPIEPEILGLYVGKVAKMKEVKA